MTSHESAPRRLDALGSNRASDPCPTPKVSIRASLRDAWKLAIPYFVTRDASGLRIGRLDLSRVQERWIAGALLGLVLALNVAQVGVSVLVNQWNGRFFNALQVKSLPAFTTELGIFSILATIFVILAAYELYITQLLVLRWRTWMTNRLLERWTNGPIHYRLRLRGDEADNPDQRIAEDVQQFASGTLAIGVQLFSSALSLVAFAGVLWGLSAGFPLRIFNFELSSIPGYLVWLALAYAIAGTALAHWIGRPLATLDAVRQRREADFRFGLVRLRENAEPVAMLGGETVERNELRSRFSLVYENTMALLKRRKMLTWFTAGYQQFSVVAPFLLLSPAYFAGNLGLGVLTQTSGALGSVQDNLSIFVGLYTTIADYSAVVSRLSGFDRSLALVAKASDTGVTRRATMKSGIRITDLVVNQVCGKPLLSVPSLEARPGDHLLLTGPSGIGKTTLLRALAGSWPHASGTFEMAPGCRIMLMPQQPYIPWGTLNAALAYPRSAPICPEATKRYLQSAGLGHLIERLHEVAPWHRILSIGEAQRLSLVRAMLASPDVLFLDEATSAVDESTEQQLYALLSSALPAAIIVSVGHRANLQGLHDRYFAVARDSAGIPELQERQCETSRSLARISTMPS
ncbi:MAG: hypothetical protein BGN89_06880 [Alphaproteobacteria bacterium 64-6]|nr:MAG: hypothetical protein BGN89_06880 [Alphaproteobacteria bacterium 64-6]